MWERKSRKRFVSNARSNQSYAIKWTISFVLPHLDESTILFHLWWAVINVERMALPEITASTGVRYRRKTMRINGKLFLRVGNKMAHLNVIHSYLRFTIIDTVFSPFWLSIAVFDSFNLCKGITTIDIQKYSCLPSSAEMESSHLRSFTIISWFRFLRTLYVHRHASITVLLMQYVFCSDFIA